MEIEHNSRQEFFRSPFGAVTCGTEVRLRLSANGMGIPRAVKLIYKTDGGEETYHDMPYVFSILGSCIYETTIRVPDMAGLIWYYFQLETDNGVVYYGNNSENLGGKGETSFQSPSHSFQITVYDEKYKTPEWFKDAIAYQIFPDRFYNGNEDGSFLYEGDDIIPRKWGEQPYYKAEQFGGDYKNNDFFGGNLKGIIKKLPYLEELGITVIYMNPIFRSCSNHKYNTGNYEEIDPMFGDARTFKELCIKAKERGIRIILDGVFNHTGSDSKYFNKYENYDSVGAYQSKDSPYYSWYNFVEYPDVYESWWGIDTLPQIVETSPELRKYLLSGKNAIIKKWLRCGASGWRLDVVDELPDFFVKELRENVKKTDPDAVIIGEVWEDASNKIAYGERRQYFYGEELDSVMNYPLKNAVIEFIKTGSVNAVDFVVRRLINDYPKRVVDALMNIIDTHDTVRALTEFGEFDDVSTKDKRSAAVIKNYAAAVKKLKQAAVLQYFLPGVPSLYYGDEAGMYGFEDPFNRRCYPWGKEDGELIAFYRRMGRVRRSNADILSSGEYERIPSARSVYAFKRISGAGTLSIIVNASAADCVLPVRSLDLLSEKQIDSVEPGGVAVLK